MRGRFVPFGITEGMQTSAEFDWIRRELEKADRILMVEPRPVYEQSFLSVPTFSRDPSLWLDGRLYNSGFHRRLLRDASPAVVLFERTASPVRR